MACSFPFKLLRAVALTPLTSWPERSEVTAKGVPHVLPWTLLEGEIVGAFEHRLRTDMLGVTGEGVAGGPLTSGLQSHLP